MAPTSASSVYSVSQTIAFLLSPRCPSHRAPPVYAWSDHDYIPASSITEPRPLRVDLGWTELLPHKPTHLYQIDCHLLSFGRCVRRLLGSCLPLGWTLVPLRLQLDWHLAKYYVTSCQIGHNILPSDFANAIIYAPKPSTGASNLSGHTTFSLS